MQFLISYSERRRHGQVPQNHFTFYAQQQPYYPHGQQPQGAYAEAPPLYNHADAPPQYFAPPGASKMNPQQGPSMEMPQYGGSAPQYGGGAPQYGAALQGASAPQGPQQSGVVGADVEQGQQNQELPPRPQQARAALRGMVDRFRR
jgi:hypothetical protein